MFEKSKQRKSHSRYTYIPYTYAIEMFEGASLAGLRILSNPTSLLKHRPLLTTQCGIMLFTRLRSSSCAAVDADRVIMQRVCCIPLR